LLFAVAVFCVVAICVNEIGKHCATVIQQLPTQVAKKLLGCLNQIYKLLKKVYELSKDIYILLKEIYVLLKDIKELLSERESDNDAAESRSWNKPR